MNELGDGSHNDSKHVGIDGAGEAEGVERVRVSRRSKEKEGTTRELTGSKPPSRSDGSVAGTSFGRTLVPRATRKKASQLRSRTSEGR